jgi:hypothetical protein
MSQPAPLLRRSAPLLTVASAVLAAAAAGTVASAAGKPGYPDKVVWGGVTWQVKTSRSAVGPGPNLFDKANVWVDTGGRLHLRIAKDASGAWSCAEIIAPTSYGYGTYTFELASPVDALDPNAVLGLFTWSDRAQYAHREIDVEFARWANAADPTNAQYVVQPYDRPSHLKRFTQPAAPASLHRFSWHPGQLAWESHDQNGALIDQYSYSGSDVPRSGDERVHLNLWLFNGAAPTNVQPVEVVLSAFTFTP